MEKEKLREEISRLKEERFILMGMKDVLNGIIDRWIIHSDKQKAKIKELEEEILELKDKGL